jgi:hypothetical protein
MPGVCPTTSSFHTRPTAPFNSYMLPSLILQNIYTSGQAECYTEQLPKYLSKLRIRRYVVFASVSNQIKVFRYVTPCMLHRDTKVSEEYSSSTLRWYTENEGRRLLRNVGTCLRIYMSPHILQSRDYESSACATRLSHLLLTTVYKETMETPRRVTFAMIKLNIIIPSISTVSTIKANAGCVTHEEGICF